jgi:nucleoside-diphosphate kinase
MKKLAFAALLFTELLLAAEIDPVERTLSIVKPDAVASGHIGDILEYFEHDGLRIVGAKLIRLTPEQAKEFYAEHKARPFYKSLVAYMTSGPVLVQVLEGPDAVARNRRIMGPTNPTEAQEGTIRRDFGISIQENAVHGSDSQTNAKKEISFFFKDSEIISTE